MTGFPPPRYARALCAVPTPAPGRQGEHKALIERKAIIHELTVSMQSLNKTQLTIFAGDKAEALESIARQSTTLGLSVDRRIREMVREEPQVAPEHAAQLEESLRKRLAEEFGAATVENEQVAATINRAFLSALHGVDTAAPGDGDGRASPTPQQTQEVTVPACLSLAPSTLPACLAMYTRWPRSIHVPAHPRARARPLPAPAAVFLVPFSESLFGALFGPLFGIPLVIAIDCFQAAREYSQPAPPRSLALFPASYIVARLPPSRRATAVAREYVTRRAAQLYARGAQEAARG